MTTTLRQIARTHLIGYTITNYDIELSHPYQVIRQGHFPSIRSPETYSRHTRTPATATTLTGESSATRSATSTEMTRAMVPHYGKPPCIPSYRDNHAPRLSVFGTPRRNTLRGPPGSSRGPRGAQRDASERRELDRKIPPACECPVNARLRRRLTRKQTKKNGRKGTGG